MPLEGDAFPSCYEYEAFKYGRSRAACTTGHIPGTSTFDDTVSEKATRSQVAERHFIHNKDLTEYSIFFGYFEAIALDGTRGRLRFVDTGIPPQPSDENDPDVPDDEHNPSKEFFAQPHQYTTRECYKSLLHPGTTIPAACVCASDTEIDLDPYAVLDHLALATCAGFFGSSFNTVQHLRQSLQVDWAIALSIVTKDLCDALEAHGKDSSNFSGTTYQNDFAPTESSPPETTRPQQMATTCREMYT
jgi:hypothetical protein